MENMASFFFPAELIKYIHMMVITLHLWERIGAMWYEAEEETNEIHKKYTCLTPKEYSVNVDCATVHGQKWQ